MRLKDATTARTPGADFPVVATVRDALYDLIPLAEPELALISTPAFLRLERIQQLGFVSRVWPGAHHTRYEHSIGVFHLARLAVAHLMRNPDPVAITVTDARTLTAAALLHDIGHYPFSHAIEELGSPILPHEVVGARLIESDPIATILRDVWGVDPTRVSSIVSPSGQSLLPVDQLLRGLLSGPLDVDKLDYLPRDARACNVPYGGVDTARLLEALRIEVIDSGVPRIVLSEKGISPLHSLINARQEMFDNVYWHHTNRAGMVMLLRAVQEALIAGVIDPQALTEIDDQKLLAMLQQPEMPAVSRDLSQRLYNRQFHKRALVISNRATDLYGKLSRLFNRPDERREIENALAASLSRALGIDLTPATVLIDIPKPEKWRTDTWIVFDDPPLGFDRAMPWIEVAGLAEADFKRYEEHRRMIRIVVMQEHRIPGQANWQFVLKEQLGGLLADC